MLAGTYNAAAGLKSDRTVVLERMFTDFQPQMSLNVAMKLQTLEWKDIIKIYYGSGVVGLDKNGTVHALNRDVYRVSWWTDIVNIAICGKRIIGLRKNGTVLC